MGPARTDAAPTEIASAQAGATARARAQVIGFLSPEPGTGRTGMLATTAAVLAAAGKRVLLLDCCHERITLDNYLWPFELVPGGDQEVVRTRARARPVVTLDQLTAETQPVLYGLPMGLGDVAMYRIEPETLGRTEAMARRIGEALLALHYDYILIDYPADSGQGYEGHVAALCDVAVLCYTPRQLEQAATVMNRLQRARGSRELHIIAAAVVPAPAVDDRWQDLPALQDVSTDALESADPAAGLHSTPDATVEVALKGYQMPGLDQVLPLFVEARADLSAYEKLASAITAGAVGLPEISPLVRARYRRVYDFSDDGRDTVTLLFAPEDRGSADWLTAVLRRGGIDVEHHEPGRKPTGRAICVISSAALRSSPAMRPILFEMTSGAGDLVWIKIDDGGPPPARRPRMTIDLAGSPTWTPISTISARFGLIKLAPERRGGDPRFPATTSVQTMSLPARNPAFVGREDVLTDLRNQLISDGAHEVVFGGGPGIGKSEIVREYAYRFAYDYDIVWWIPAQNAQSALAALTSLADRMAIKNRADAPRAAVEALGVPGAQRALLIYDNADDPAVLDDLMPAGPACSVLITSRHPEVHHLAKPIAAFTSAESVAMLVKRVPGLPDRLAEDIATAAAHHPLALRMVSAWLRESIPIRRRKENLTEALATSELATEVVTRLRSQDRTFPQELLGTPEMTIIARSLAMVLNSMGIVGLHLTVRMAELAAFLSPDGASLDLLRAGPFLKLLADEKHAVPGEHEDEAEPSPVVADEGYIDVVLWSGTRYGLFEVDWGWRGQVRIHRAVQDLLKGRMNGERAQRRGQVQLALAAYAPSDPQVEEPAHRERLSELQRHFEYCDATASADESVRHWVNKQVRYLYRLRDRITWEAALRIAETAHERWRETPGSEDDAQLYWLLAQTANLHRALGDNATARKIDEDLLAATPNAELEPTLVTLRVRRNLAGDLRGDGRFRAAWEHDKQVQDGLLAMLGRDHRDTLMSQHNLAISQFLTGLPLNALQTEEQVFLAYLRLMGPTELRVWRSLCDMGTYQRELGRFAESLATLQEARTGIRQVPGLDNRNHVDVLRIRRAIEVTRRCLAEPSFTADELREISANYAAVLEPDHPDTVACGLSLAAAYRVEGNVDLAVKTATHCLEVYERTLSEGHPFRAAASTNRGVCLRQQGEDSDAYQAAWRGYEGLNDELNADHPWTIAAAVNLAACQYSDDQADNARSLLTSTAGVSHGRLGESHPYTLAARRNLTLLEGDAPPNEWVTLDIDVPQT